MAARKRKVVLSDDWKASIKVSQIMNRLSGHIDGTVELSQTQINAAKIVLAKLVPDLKAMELSGDSNNPVAMAITWQKPE